MKPIIFYTFSRKTDEWNEDYEMLKLSMMSVRRELGNSVEIQLYTDIDNMQELEELFNVITYIIKPSDYLTDEINLNITSDELKHFNFIGHARLFIIKDLIEDNVPVLYLDNDTGLAYNSSNILNAMMNETDFLSYSYEFHKFDNWIKVSYHKTNNKEISDDLYNKVVESDFGQHLNKMTFNAGALFYPSNQKSKDLINKTIDAYYLINKLIGHGFGDDQTALALAIHQIYSHYETPKFIVRHPVFNNIIHYYREKHNTNRKTVIRLLKERELFNISWNDLITKKINYINLHPEIQTINKILMIENNENNKINLNEYYFYPHLDILTDKLILKNENDNTFNSNGLSLEKIDFSNFYRRFESSINGLYIKKEKNTIKSTIKNKKIIHQIWIGKHNTDFKFTEKWKELNPEYEYNLWTDDNIDLDILGDNKQIYLDEIDFRLKAKILSYHLIYNYGGIYIDIDCMPLKPLDDDVLTKEIFFVYENEYLFGVQFSHYVMGCIKNSVVMKTIIEQITKNKCIIITEINNLIKGLLNLFIYPSYYFYPNHYYGNIDSPYIYMSYCSHIWITECNKIKYNLEYLNEQVDKLENITDKECMYYGNLFHKTKYNLNFLLKAIENNKRIDIYYYLGRYYNLEKDYENSYKYLILGKELIDKLEPNIEYKILMDKKENIISSRIIDFDLLDELSIVCFHLKKKDEGKEAISLIKNKCLLSNNLMLYLKNSSRLEQNYKLFN